MGKTEKFSLSFTVNNFSEVKEDLLSQPVIAHDLKWRILIRPTNIEQDGQQKKMLGYFLQCDGPDGGSKASSWSCQASADLRVIAVREAWLNVSKKVGGPENLFSSKNKCWGYIDFMEWADVENPWGGLIENNSVTFLASITADEPLLCERCEERACKVCLKEEVCIVFDPCYHLATCTKCSSSLKECPICRGKINKKTRVFV